MDYKEKLTIKDIVDKLNYIIKREEEGFHVTFVGINEIATFDLESFHSNRGYYCELGVNIKPIDYYENRNWGTKPQDIRDAFLSQIGKTYEGWKGGDFTMDEYTPVNISAEGYSGNGISCLYIKESSYKDYSGKIDKRIIFGFRTFSEWEEGDLISFIEDVKID